MASISVSHFFQLFRPFLPAMFSSHFWQPFLAAISGIPFWQPFLAAIPGSHFFHLFLAAISGSPLWQLFLAAIPGSHFFHFSQPDLAAISSSYLWQLFQAAIPAIPAISAISFSHFWQLFLAAISCSHISQLFLAAILSSYPRYYMTFPYQANIYSGIRRAFLWPPDPSTHREWSSERLRELLKRETAAGLRGQALNLPAYRDIAIGISRRYMRPSSIYPMGVGDLTVRSIRVLPFTMGEKKWGHGQIH
jgi:hypothetical protein